MFHLEGITTISFRATKIVSPVDKNDCLLFDGKGFSGSSFRARDENGQICLFKEINDFIAKNLSKEEQVKLFTVYSTIDQYFDNSNQMRRKGGNIVDTFDTGLSKHIQKIFDIVKYKDVKDYMLNLYKKGIVRLPDDIYDDYRIEDKMQQKHIDCTYLIPDYLDLMVLSLYTRLLIPIWGRYLPITRFDSRYALKEYHALKLIEGTSLFKEFVFKRLDTYIRGTVDIEDNLSIMVSGLSNEEIPFFLMSQIVVKRLPIFSISYTDNSDRNNHLMSMMFHLIGTSGKAGKLGQSLKSPIYDKKPVETEWSDEDNSSVWDMYKSRELISGGDLAVTEVYLIDFCHGDNPELTKICYDYIQDMDLRKIAPVQIQLMTWIVSVLIPGNVVPLFEGSVLRRALAISQSQLFTWGFTNLAILLTAETIPLEKDTFVSNLGQKPITNERKLELDKVYGLTGAGDAKYENIGVKAIQEMSKKFFESDWGVDCPKELYEDNEELKISPIFATPGDIRNDLADLLIKLSVS